LSGKLYENLKSLAVALILALLIREFVVQSFHIPSGSMIPTLLIGDFILVDKVTYRFREPERGDVVVFHYPLNEKTYFVKRIVGLPGDRIEVRGGELFVNGKPCKYQYLGTYSYEEDGVRYEGDLYYEFIPRRDGSEKKHFVLKTGTYGDDTEVYTVPKGKYFVMGDNRNNSSDSRRWGFLDGEKIVGIARIIFFSWDGERHLPRFNRILRPID